MVPLPLFSVISAATAFLTSLFFANLSAYGKLQANYESYLVVMSPYSNFHYLDFLSEVLGEAGEDMSYFQPHFSWCL